MDLSLWVAALALALLAGVVKGMTGFAMPVVLMSGLSLFLPAETALAGMIGALFVSNIMQLLREGAGAAWRSIAAHRVFIGLVVVFLGASTQLVPLVDGDTLYLIIGLIISAFACVQIFGLRLTVAPERSKSMTYFLGAVTGVTGGLSGIWGPPTVAYLLTLDLERKEYMRVLGAVFGLGSVVLAAGHLASGVLNAATLPLSIALIAPAMLGMWLGYKVQDRLDKARLLQIILWVMLLGGLNLIRRGLF